MSGAASMKAIDRVMRAYQSKRVLTAEDALRVRSELSKFIDELMSGAAMTSSKDAEIGK